LVREVVYNELHDHDQHGYWRYWIERRSQRETRVEEQVETAEGPVTRLDRSNGRPLDPAGRLAEDRRLGRLLSSAEEQARYRQQYAEDERRIGRIVALLPEAFVYEYAGEENGCTRLRFRPDPKYPAHSIEARVFHAMSGEFRLQRTRVSPSDWKTEGLEVHMNGRAMLFKTIARETSESRGGFVAVPAGMNLAQGVSLLNQVETSGAAVSAASFAMRR
jgi:hypothetical protein